MSIAKKKEFEVLIVTENVVYRNNLASALRMQGHVVEFAHGGFHLLHLLEYPNAINLIVVHEDMQDMSAYEIVSLTRTNRDPKELPILFVSKNLNDENIREMLSIGTNDCIVQTPGFQPIIAATKKYCSN